MTAISVDEEFGTFWHQETKPTIRSLGSRATDEKVVGFYITVYEIFLVDGLDS